MALYYGTGLGGATTGSTTFDRNYVRQVKDARGRLRVTAGSITKLLTTGSTDYARLITLPTTARIWQLFFNTNGVAAAGACNIGAYTAGESHDGAVVDDDLIATAVSVTSASNADILAEAAAANQLLRGKMLWELFGQTVDPGGYYDLTITPSTTFTTTAPFCQLVAFYTAGD